MTLTMLSGWPRLVTLLFPPSRPATAEERALLARIDALRADLAEVRAARCQAAEDREAAHSALLDRHRAELDEFRAAEGTVAAERAAVLEDLRDQLAVKKATIAVRDHEVAMLWGVVTRDRQRVQAEAAAPQAPVAPPAPPRPAAGTVADALPPARDNVPDRRLGPLSAFSFRRV